MTSELTPDEVRFNDVIRSIIEETMLEGHILEHKTIDVPAVLTFARAITQQFPNVEADLRKRFGEEAGGDPDHFLPEVVQSLVHLAWDYGFRAGRIWQARDYGIGVPGEES